MIVRQTTLIPDSAMAAAIRRVDGNAEWLDMKALKAHPLEWSSNGTAPALVNGTSAGRYALAGKLCYFEGILTLGSGTTVGTGAYSVARRNKALLGTGRGQCLFFDASTGNLYPGVVYLNQTTLRSASFVVGTAYWGAAAPVVPAAGDVMRFSLWYPWQV